MLVLPALPLVKGDNPVRVKCGVQRIVGGTGHEAARHLLRLRCGAGVDNAGLGPVEGNSAGGHQHWRYTDDNDDYSD
jgi:hypothetical protein